jgi:hypothetical protein
MRNACKISIGTSQGERPRRRGVHMWEDNIKKDDKEIGHEDVD